jgi:hypothetical protein
MRLRGEARGTKGDGVAGNPAGQGRGRGRRAGTLGEGRCGRSARGYRLAGSGVKGASGCARFIAASSAWATCWSATASAGETPSS